LLPEHPVSADNLPEDPLSMPPPYWRSSGAIFHVRSALRTLEQHLNRLAKLSGQIQVELADFHRRHQSKAAQVAAKEEYKNILHRALPTEVRIRLSCEIICLMSAIEAEDCVNCFCVFNLHKHIAEGIERLSLPEKLTVACTCLGAPDVKGLRVYESARKLVAWRNAFAHGHCVDRPTKSLRSNHLITPDELWSAPAVVRDAKFMASAYLEIADHLRAHSKNAYTASKNWDDEEVKKSLRRLSRFVFTGPNANYSLHVARKAGA
jgi:hypothetical protein